MTEHLMLQKGENISTLRNLLSKRTLRRLRKIFVKVRPDNVNAVKLMFWLVFPVEIVVRVDFPNFEFQVSLFNSAVRIAKTCKKE